MLLTRIAPVAFFAFGVLAAPQSESLIAGYGYVPPLHFKTADGSATGFVVDVINEAARIENIKITWRATDGSKDVEKALSEGRIDIFPAGVVTRDRLARFWVSDPWWSDELSVLTKGRQAGIHAAKDLNGKRVFLVSPAYIDLAKQLWPATKLILPEMLAIRGYPYDVSASLLCNDKIDGAFMAHSEIDEVLLNKLGTCAAGKLQILETPKTVDLAVIARVQKSSTAQRLRMRIDDLSMNGGLTRIAGRYPRLPGRSAVALAETLRMRYERGALQAWLFTSILLAGIAIVLLVRELQAKRTLGLALTQLRAQSDRLAASNEELQAFAYSISHDMQEPLRTISIYSQLLEQRSPPESKDGQLYLRTIQTGTKRLHDMLEKLLLLSRVGHSDLEPVPVALDSVVEIALRNLDSMVQSTGATIQVTSPLPAVTGWPDRLNVLIQNLIVNALKYRREGVAPLVQIRAERAGTDWRIAIQDNGIGFPQEYAEQIFGVFKRLHAREKYSGSGVGLAIARKVIERHGGRIWAERHPGEGSTFFFTLPAKEARSRGD